MLLRNVVEQFAQGQIDTIEARKISAGAASAALNWLHSGDRIELRRGYQRLGSDDGVGKVTGLHVGLKADGSQVLFKTYARKVKYYVDATDTFTEVGTDILPAAASGEDIVFDNYASLAGSQTFMSSKNSGFYKFMTANPGSYVDLTDASKNFKGFIRIFFNRVILWGRKEDRSGIYGSYIDAAVYTTVSAEVLGASGSTTYSGTLAFKGGSALRTCFGVLITGTTAGGVETFRDDYSGNLVGSLGGTGTINYTSGAYSVTFNGAVTSGNVTADYQWENSNNTGLGDFSKSTPRTAGQGFTFRQDDGGGDAQSVGLYGEILYCLHKYRTWQLTISTDDTDATNLPYRDRVGIPNHRAKVDTGVGIYYVDDTDLKDPQLRILTLEQLSGLVIPRSISKKVVKGIPLGVDLSGYIFDKAAAIEWGDYIVFACRTEASTVNNRVITYNKNTGAINYHDYFVTCFAIYNGSLLAGDALSNNVLELFSGFDDDSAKITTNVYETELSDLDVAELKKCKRLGLQGLISSNQEYRVYISLDNGAYSLVGTVSGSGGYVDSSTGTTVGSSLVGSTTIGGTGGVTVYNYELQLPLRLQRFELAKLKFVATGLGYVSINKYMWYDIRKKVKKLPQKYRN